MFAVPGRLHTMSVVLNSPPPSKDARAAKSDASRACAFQAKVPDLGADRSCLRCIHREKAIRQFHIQPYAAKAPT